MADLSSIRVQIADPLFDRTKITASRSHFFRLWGMSGSGSLQTAKSGEARQGSQLLLVGGPSKVAETLDAALARVGFYWTQLAAPQCDRIEGENTGERGDRDSDPDPSAWAHAFRGTGQSHCFLPATATR